MKIEFYTTKLEKSVSSKNIVAVYGAERAKKIIRRLADLQAAPCLAVMFSLPGKCHLLTADRAGQFAIEIAANFRLIFKPDHEPLPLKTDGGLDPELVTRITVLEIGTDYH